MLAKRPLMCPSPLHDHHPLPLFLSFPWPTVSFNSFDNRLTSHIAFRTFSPLRDVCTFSRNWWSHVCAFPKGDLHTSISEWVKPVHVPVVLFFSLLCWKTWDVVKYQCLHPFIFFLLISHALRLFFKSHHVGSRWEFVTKTALVYRMVSHSGVLLVGFKMR